MAANRYERKQNAYKGSSYYTYGNVAYDLQPDYTPYYTHEEEELQKAQARLAKAELRETRLISLRSVAIIIVLFLGCIAFMGMNVIVANENLELRRQKSSLAELKATNAILAAEITEQMDMDYIKQEASQRLGMAEPQPYQITYIDVPKQSYTVQYAVDETEESSSVLAKISNIMKKD